MSRSLLVILLLATLPILTHGATPIPKRGNWTLNAEMTGGGIVQWQAKEPVVFTVPACADPIAMHHPDLDGGSLKLSFLDNGEHQRLIVAITKRLDDSKLERYYAGLVNMTP